MVGGCIPKPAQGPPWRHRGPRPSATSQPRHVLACALGRCAHLTGLPSPPRRRLKYLHQTGPCTHSALHASLVHERMLCLGAAAAGSPELLRGLAPGVSPLSGPELGPSLGLHSTLPGCPLLHPSPALPTTPGSSQALLRGHHWGTLAGPSEPQLCHLPGDSEGRPSPRVFKGLKQGPAHPSSSTSAPSCGLRPALLLPPPQPRASPAPSHAI